VRAVSTLAAGSAPARRAPLRPSSFAAGRAALGRLAATAWLEVRLNLGVPAPWLIGVVLGGFGYLAVRTAPDATSFPLAWALSREIGQFAVLLLALLAASFAYRPIRYDMTELLDSKRTGSEELILGRWLGMVAGIAAPVLFWYAVTAAAQHLEGKGAVEPLAYAHSVARLAPSALLLSTLAFSLVTLTRVLILGGGLAGLAWFVLYFGHAFYPTSLRPDLSQNAPVILGLTAALLLAMLAAYQGRRRAKGAVSTYLLGWSAAAAAFGALIGAARTEAALHPRR